MAVRTEIHTTGDTRERALVVVSDAAFEALLFLSYLELERFYAFILRWRHYPNTLKAPSHCDRRE